jgi:iron complex outermembrane receptor protein
MMLQMKKNAILFLLGLILLPMGHELSATEQVNDTTDYFNLSLEELMNMEIVAVSKKAENSFDAPLSASIITKEEIINSGATTLEEVFRLVPGFIVREESNGNYDIHIRGNDNIPPGNFTFFSENAMSLIMIDGRKVFNNMNGGTFWETLPVSITDIERIEIIRGASTALYGPNAVSGVINFITKKSPDKSIAVDGNLQLGTAATKLGDFGINTSSANNKFKTRLSANLEQRDRFDANYYGWISGEYAPYTELKDYLSGGTIGENDPKFENHELAKNRHGVNGWINYSANEDVNFNISGGYQNSKAQTVFMESSLSPLTFRESETYYFNTQSNLYGLSLQLSGNFGTQDILLGSGVVSKYDMSNIDVVAEYDWNIGDLTLRPGISYQHIVYNDLPYATGNKTNKGYLNAEAKLTNLAYFLRGDYKASEKIRLIAALRMDHYNEPHDPYFTYQLISTFKPSEKNLFRASYARANRGPVMVDFYADHLEGAPEAGYVTQYLGGHELELPLNDVFEAGYRGQLSDYVQIDLEGFYSKTKNFPSFEPTVDVSQGYVHTVYQYQNISAISEQLGATASLFYAPNTKLQLKAWGTLQETTLKDYDKKVTPLIIDQENMVFLNPTYERTEEKHKQTPSFFGGLSANYRPVEKLNIFTSVHYTGAQTYQHDYSLYGDLTGMGSGYASVAAKTIVNAKVSYKIYKNSSIFLNARNAFGSTTPEFGLADHTKGLYLAGININL